MANENNVKSSSGNLPFYLRPLATPKNLPRLVVRVQRMAADTIKNYTQPVDLASNEAIQTFQRLIPYVPDVTWSYLREILLTVNVFFTIKHPRSSLAGDCRIDRSNRVAYVTINAMENKWKFLCVVLHELAHVLNHMRYTAHDMYWKTFYAVLLADFYEYFPAEYRHELIWGMVYTPASSRSTNFNGHAVLFGIADELTDEAKAANFENIRKVDERDAVVLSTTQDAESPKVANRPEPHQHILERQGAGYVSHVKPEQIAHNLTYNFAINKSPFVLSCYKGKRFENVLKFPNDLCGSDRFLKLVNAMPWQSRSAVMECYGIIHGDGALRYAERTMHDWLSGRVNGWAPLRFFDITPLVFPIEKRKELCKIIIDYNDEVSEFQYRYPVSREQTTILSLTLYKMFRFRIKDVICRYVDTEVKTFDYETRYKADPYGGAVWWSQKDMVAYRKELSEAKRKELLKQVENIDGKFQELESQYNSIGSAETSFIFPDRVFKIKITSTVRAFFRRLAVTTGVSKDFILSNNEVHSNYI